MSFRILFVDDEFAPDSENQLGSYMSYYELELKECNHLVVRTSTVDEALHLLSANTFDVAILDVMMPPGIALERFDTANGMRSGLVLARKVHELYPNLRILILSNVAENRGAFTDLLEEKIIESVLFKLETTPASLAALLRTESREEDHA